MIRLLRPDQPDPSIKRPMAEVAEAEKVGRVYVVVHESRVLAPGHVLETGARRPAIAAKIEFLFQCRVQSEVVRKAVRAGAVNQLLELVNGDERKTAAPYHGVRQFGFFELPECRQRQK